MDQDGSAGVEAEKQSVSQEPSHSALTGILWKNKEIKKTAHGLLGWEIR
jgi:hypothetical protein